MESLISLLRDDRFMPHGHCYLWIPELLWTNVISDAVITLSYLTIPITLIYFIRKRRDLPFDWMFTAFGIFILACGSTHLIDIWTIWHPDYWLSAFVKTITAGASVVTAVLLIELVPAALLIPSPQQLARVNEELREAQAELVTAARQAGMAEIATNVLHNVGNVLNSVNVSADLVSRRVRASKSQGLAKAVQLLNEHAADLGDFISHDAKGKLLPAYLNQLVEALAAEQQGIVEELEHLTKSVDHIKEIVATQQSYAGASSMLEPVRLADLLEDALRMNAGALVRHRVRVIKAFAEVPPLLLDKHRLLLILVNLISNAKQALSAQDNRAHVLTLSVRLLDEGKLQICVQDDGEGIAAENLTRIFAHGFTTRKDGHGFGLHSCALAAMEMEATLTAHSDGPGQGAAFVLELPAHAVQGTA
jgi:signal transduction histidine kinase